MKRRGQLTIFLAAGVVVVFAFAFLFILSSQINNNSILAVNEDVPPPLLSYVKNTLEDAARSAVIETIAPQSGYQDPTSAENQQPTQFYGKELEMNFESEDVRYQTLEEYPYPEYPYTMPPEAPPHPVAYYYLLGKFNIPSLERIRKELLAETEKRFNENLDLSPFEGQYYRLVYPDQEPVINLSINFEDITVNLYYPLEVVTESQRSRLPNMTVNLPIRLNRTYELANCLVDKVVFDEGRDTYDPLDEAPDGDAFQECKAELGLDDYFTTRTVPVRGVLDGEFKGRLVGINDTKNQEDTGVAFEFQYLIWKCSGNFFADSTSEGVYDEQRMRVCEYACAKEIPEAVALGICQQESDCEHFASYDPFVPKEMDLETSGSSAMGIMQLLANKCYPGANIGGSGSLIDGATLVRKDLEDNIECAMELINDNLGRSGERYCCPTGKAGAEKPDHVCCLNPDHPCCLNPEHPCCTKQLGVSKCGRESDDPIFNPCPQIVKPNPIYQPNPLLPDYDSRKTVTAINYYLSCCDPTGGSAGTPSPHRCAGYCCSENYKLPDPVWGEKTVCGDKPEPEGNFKENEVLTKDATYIGWDAAIRGYYGYLCGDISNVGIEDVDIQNYVELIHKWIKTDADLYPSYLYNYPNERKYSLCHSYNRPEPEMSSVETELNWQSQYTGLLGQGYGVNNAGCCCQPESVAGYDCCKEFRLESGTPDFPTCEMPS